MKTLFCELVARKGWVSAATLEECSRAGRQEDPQRPLGLLLVERGHLTPAQLTQVLGLERRILKARLARRRGEESASPGGVLTQPGEDRLLALRVIELGLSSSEQLEDAFRVQRERARGDRTPALHELVVELGHLTPHQVHKLRKSFLAGRVICYRCRKKVRFPAGQRPEACPQCGVEFPRDPRFKSGAWLVASWPQHLGDKLLGRMLTKSGVVKEEIVRQCRAIQKVSYPAKELGKVLLEHGHLSFNDLYRLYQARRQKLEEVHPHLEAQRRDVRLARLLVTHMFVSLGKANDALIEQVRVEKETGAHRPLIEILAEQGLLTPHQAKVAIPELFSGLLEEEEDIYLDLEKILCEERGPRPAPAELQPLEARGEPEPDTADEDEELPDADSVFEEYE